MSSRMGQESATSTRGRTKVTATQSSSSLTNLIGSDGANTPIGVRLWGSCFKFSSTKNKRAFHQGLVLLLTFIAYAAFHMGRRPFTIVKNVLNRDCSKLINSTSTLASSITTSTISTTPTISPDPFYLEDISLLSSEIESTSSSLLPPPLPIDTSCDWAPFDDNATANDLFGLLDTSFLMSYAIFMFFSGYVAERTNLRYFVSLGAILSGLGLIAFGFSYSLDIHSMTYFMIIQIASGAVQTTGWPVVVTCVSNWFEESKRGTIYGLWNSHTNLGNILGALIAGYFVQSDWGLSFIVPGALMIIVGIILFLFLVPSPKDVHLNELQPQAEEILEESISTRSKRGGDQIATTTTSSQFRNLDLEISPSSSLGENNLGKSEIDLSGAQHTSQKPISFWKALKIPGVIEYSWCLFFSKLVSYTFLFWLPRYITASTDNDSQDSAYLSTPFDVGGIVGAIVAGYLSDRFKVNGIICNIMLLVAIPSLFAYQQFGALSSLHNILLQLLVGMLVNGPYCLITTAVSADLGNRIKDGHAMATVSAIIDGMGSVGAALGPLLAGKLSAYGWRAVFLMLMLSDVFASLCIVRVTIYDVRKLMGGAFD